MVRPLGLEKVRKQAETRIVGGLIVFGAGILIGNA